MKRLVPFLPLLALVALVLYPVVWVLLGEMFPNQMRGSSLAVAGLARRRKR
jgi:SP family sugar:H+ symporter-like MFS transporter